VLLAPEQIVVVPAIEAVGFGLATTVAVADPVQPLAFVAVTLTAPAVDTVIEGVLAPVDHE
jgi:hypothetical protein